MREDLLKQAGFSANDDPELLRKLEVLAFLIEKHRTEQLMTMFEAFVKSELRTCAMLCRHAGHNGADALLQARADDFSLSADEVMACHLRGLNPRT